MSEQPQSMRDHVLIRIQARAMEQGIDPADLPPDIVQQACSMAYLLAAIDAYETAYGKISWPEHPSAEVQP